MAERRHPILGVVIPLWLAFALAISLGFQVQRLAPSHDHNQATFFSLESGLDEYVLPRAWRPRVLSNWAATFFVSYEGDGTEKEVDRAEFGRSIRAWTVFWFLATSLVFVLALREGSIFFMLGTYAGVSYGYMPGIAARVYPWDLPALFFATLFTVAVHRRKYGWLFAIPAAVLFKETVLVFLLAFLAWEGKSWKKRLGLFFGTAVFSVALRALVAHLVGNPTLLRTFSGAVWKRLGENFAQLTVFDGRHPFLYDAGLILAFLLLPWGDRRLWLWKAIGVAIVAGQFLWAVVTEVRIWFEAIPVCLLGLAIVFPRWLPPPPPEEADSDDGD